MDKPKFKINGDTYTFFTKKSLGIDITSSKKQINTILKLYCGERFLTSSEISLKLGIPPKHIEAFMRMLGKNHNSVPFLDFELEHRSEDGLVADMLAIKKQSIVSKYELAILKHDQEDAAKWRQLQSGILDPVETYLQKYRSPKQNTVVTKPSTENSESELLIGCSDWHYGLIANERYLYNQKEWNIDKTVEAVARYADKLKEDIDAAGYKKINILFMGDISHSLSGFTDKGTKLEAYPLGEEQFDIAYQSLVNFVESILSVHNNVQVYSCSGNHDSVADYILIRMLEIYFKNDRRIKFEITNKRCLTFKVEKSLFLMEHGASAFSKLGKVPSPGVGRENYLNNLFMSKPDLMHGIKHKYVLFGDKHHHESYELNNVECYLFSTIVGGCRYSDNSGFKSRPRQSCLVVNNDGVVEQKNFYFD